MIFAVYGRESDTCGNEEHRLIGYCEFDSIEDAKKEFPRGFLGGYTVSPITVSAPDDIKERNRNKCYVVVDRK